VFLRLRDLKYELLEHPPDLAPSDFHLFLKLKIFLAGKCFPSNEEAIAVVEEYFEELLESHFREGIRLLEKCWTKYIEVEGDYIEK